jgi:hypothetical protein
MSPIEIYINTKLVWSDDIDLTNVPKDQVQTLIMDQQKNYKEVLSQLIPITDLHFTIVQYHHSKVYISTI